MISGILYCFVKENKTYNFVWVNQYKPNISMSFLIDFTKYSLNFLYRLFENLFKLLTSYIYWTIKLVYLCGNKIPRRQWTKEQKLIFLLNSKAWNVMLYALSEEEYTKVHSFKSVKQMWDTLVVTYEGTSQEKGAN